MNIFAPFKWLFGSDEPEEGLPDRIYYVILKPPLWLSDKKFQKAWEKTIVKNHNLLVPSYCENIPWQYATAAYADLKHFLNKNPDPTFGDFSSDDVLQYFSAHQMGDIRGLVSDELAFLLDESPDFFVMHSSDITDEVHGTRGIYFNWKRRMDAVAEAIDSGKMPGTCPGCTLDFKKHPPTEQGKCTKCHYQLNEEDDIDEDDLEEVLIDYEIDIDIGPATIGDLVYNSKR